MKKFFSSSLHFATMALLLFVAGCSSSTTEVGTKIAALDDATKEANDNNAAIQKGLNAAALSADNILTRICAAIVKAENTPVKAKLDDESIQQLNVLHDQWMEQEKQILADHIIQQESLWHKQSHRLTDIVRNNEGVWLSQHLFYIVGSLSLLSIITIVLEIAFYVYFNWIT